MHSHLFALVTIFLDLVTAQSVFISPNQPMGSDTGFGQGVVFDDTCKPYDTVLRQTIETVNQIARRSYAVAKVPGNPIFKLFFRPVNSATVKLLMKIVVRSIGGHDNRVLITCREDEFCGNGDAYTYRRKILKEGDTHNDDFINICPHAVNGSRALQRTFDGCSIDMEGKSMDMVLLKQMLLMWNIANQTALNLHVLGVKDCQRLTYQKVVDQHGENVTAVLNVPNYVFFAKAIVKWRAQKGGLCKEAQKVKPMLDDTDELELRKLLHIEADGDGDSVIKDEDGSKVIQVAVNATSQEDIL